MIGGRSRKKCRGGRKDNKDDAGQKPKIELNMDVSVTLPGTIHSKAVIAAVSSVATETTNEEGREEGILHKSDMSVAEDDIYGNASGNRYPNLPLQ